MAKTASIDEFMEKRRAQVGKGQGGHDVVFKGLRAPPSLNAETRTAEFIMSSERIDRDGDVVRQKGLSIVEFKKNPVALLFHSSRSWPIGTWSDVKKDTKATPPNTSGALNFLPAGGPVQEVDQAFWMVQQGALRAVSIGFMPLELEIIEHKDGESPWGYGYDILKAEMYECSLVSVPSQPDALAKGLIEADQMAPAREFIEQALDDWARDPRTGMLIPRKELEGIYKTYFGKQYGIMLAVDSYADPEKTALVRVEKAIATAGEAYGIKQPMVPPDDPAAGDPTADDDSGEIEAISGIEIEFPITVNLTITQGNTGANTRVGSEVGDAGTAAADANVQGNGVSQRDAGGADDVAVDGSGRPSVSAALKRLDAALKRFFGGEKTATPEPKLVPGAYEQRKERLSAMSARLQGLG